MKTAKKLRLFLGMSWEISPGYLMMLIFSTLVSSAQVLLNVILPRFLIDELVGARDVRRLVIFGGLIVLSNLLLALLGNASKRYLDVKNIWMSEMMQRKLAEKIMNVEFSYLETPKYLDMKERAAFAITNQNALYWLVHHFATVLKNLVTVAGLIGVMFTLSPALAAVLGGITAVNLFRYARFTKSQTLFYQSIIPFNRKYNYYVGCCYNDKLQKDVRLYGMSGMLTERVGHYNLEMNKTLQPFHQKEGRFLGLYGVLNDLQAALAYGYVGLRVFTDTLGPRISVGLFSMYVNAAINFTLQTLDLGKNVVSLLQRLAYLEPFAEFMSLPDEKDVSGDAELTGDIEEIRFEDVSFCYPGSGRLVLDGVSFSVGRGEKVSVVGLNGAGKTTLVKLLCRLYRPASGKITVNGRDIYDYSHASYMRAVSAVFQDYKLFAFSVEENISGHKPDGNGARTRDIIAQVGLDGKMGRLEKGTATLLGKAYDEEGTEFSGGEEQKVAIARALYKDASLIILDEPTSALDPLAEAEIYEHFNALIGGKTALYISHRMSSSVFCDRILVIDGGRVSDYDTHAALMKKTDGTYYKLFVSQADNYKIEERFRPMTNYSLSSKTGADCRR